MYIPDSIEDFGDNLKPFIPDADDFIKGGVDFNEQADMPEMAPRWRRDGAEIALR